VIKTTAECVIIDAIKKKEKSASRENAIARKDKKDAMRRVLIQWSIKKIVENAETHAKRQKSAQKTSVKKLMK
jgi:hypothetical protein